MSQNQEDKKTGRVKVEVLEHSSDLMLYCFDEDNRLFDTLQMNHDEFNKWVLEAVKRLKEDKK